MQINQKLTIDGSTRRKDPKTGYLYATALAAKVGVQTYHHSEIGVDAVDDTGLVRVARLPNQVFSADSLDSWVGVDMTNNHPTEGLVDVENHKQLSVGHVVGTASQMGNHISIPVVVKDSATIRDIEYGKSELSAGYLAKYEREAGTFDGELYDYIQKNIRVNHLAVVAKGRAKSTIILDSEVDMEKITELTNRVAELEAENLVLSARPTYDSLGEILSLTKDAESINPDGDYLGKNPEEIKRTALGDTVTADHSVDVVNFAFKQALTALVVTVDEKPEIDDVKSETPTLVLDAKVVDNEPSSHDNYIKSLNIAR